MLLLTFSDIGLIVTLVIIAAGLGLILKLALKGKEIDRRIIFIFIFFSVASPIIFQIKFSEKATAVVKSIYDKIDNLPEGSKILISFDFDPAMAPEVQPMAIVLGRHALIKGHEVVFMSLWTTGQSLLTEIINEYILPDFPEKQEFIDYVTLGFKAGNEGVLKVIATDFKKMFPVDNNGRPLDSIPIFDGVKSCSDFDLVISIGGGKPGPKEWILFVTDPSNIPMAVGVAAVIAPQMYPYYPAQVLGIMGGVKGAAEYESEFIGNYERFKDMKTPGLLTMGPQTLAHTVIMAFIIIGNIIYFRKRKKEAKS